GRTAWATGRPGGVHELQCAPVTQPRRSRIAGRLKPGTPLSSIQLFGLAQQAVGHVVPLQRPLKLVVFVSGEVVGRVQLGPERTGPTGQARWGPGISHVVVPYASELVSKNFGSPAVLGLEVLEIGPPFPLPRPESRHLADGHE